MHGLGFLRVRIHKDHDYGDKYTDQSVHILSSHTFVQKEAGKDADHEWCYAANYADCRHVKVLQAREGDKY